MRYTYICCLGEDALGHILGTYNLLKLEKLGYDASKLCILEFSPILRLRIYKESEKVRQDILQSMYQKVHLIIHPEGMMGLFPGSQDIGGGLAVVFDSSSGKLASAFLRAFSMERLHVVSCEQYQDLLMGELSNITVRALWRRIDTRMRNTGGVYTLEWAVSKHPLIS